MVKLKSSSSYCFLIAMLPAYCAVTVKSSPTRMYAFWEVGPRLNIEKKKNLVFQIMILLIVSFIQVFSRTTGKKCIAYYLITTCFVLDSVPRFVL